MHYSERLRAWLLNMDILNIDEKCFFLYERPIRTLESNYYSRTNDSKLNVANASSRPNPDGRINRKPYSRIFDYMAEKNMTNTTE